MQFASFDTADLCLEAFGYVLSLQWVTTENLYGLDPKRLRIERSDEAVVVHADGLMWAGGSERAPGESELRVERAGPGAIRIRARGRARHPLRCAKLVLRNLDLPLEIVEHGAARAVPESGELLAYPMRIPTPLLHLRSGGASLCARADESRVRGKRFAVYTERTGPHAGRGALELVHEAAAPEMGEELEVPDFVVARDVDPEVFEAEHVAGLEARCGLRPFAQRDDVPAWLPDLRLVLTLHGMHWTGRVFLTYADMAEILRAVATRLEGRRVLAYLPGWEGRYYWQYGDYRPEPRLGGEAGFARLCDAARRLGVHLMPMFGVNCVNAWQPRWQELPSEAFLESATGLRFAGNAPDWDLSRTHDPGWQAWLNPGHPAWRDALAGDIEALAQRYGFDAVFLDTTEIWTNDPHHDVHAGLHCAARRTRARLRRARSADAGGRRRTREGLRSPRDGPLTRSPVPPPAAGSRAA